jgi:hypothetical protein
VGGSNEDEGTALALDGAGNAYIAGYTMSPDYPVTVGAFQTSFAGTMSAFVTALDQNGGLIYSTFLNGSATSSAAGIAADTGGNAYVTGVTTSTDFPVTAGAYQTTLTPSSRNDRAAFVAKLNPNGTGLEYSTLLGPPSYMAGKAIGLDGVGNAFIAGLMYAGGDAGGAMCPATNFDCGFVAKLNRRGAALDFSRLLNFRDGGYSEPRSIAVDSAGNSHLVGNFGASGEHFGFLQNFDTGGAASNFINLSNALSPNAIALGPSGDIFITGTAFGGNLATTPGAFQPRDAGSVNAFLNEYDPSGTAPLYSTYLGGSDQDEAYGVAVDGSGNAYVTGYTQSNDFPVTPGALQSTHGGDIAHAGTLDAFVARIVPSAPLSPSPTPTASASPTIAPTSSATAPIITATPTVMRTPLPTRIPSPILTTTSTARSTASATPVTLPPLVESIEASPDPLDFHGVKVGRISPPRFVNVVNPESSQSSLAIARVALGGAAMNFTIDASRSTCRTGARLLPGKSCKVAIDFAPKSRSIKMDTLSISMAPGAVTKAVRLLGIGR